MFQQSYEQGFRQNPISTFLEEERNITDEINSISYLVLPFPYNRIIRMRLFFLLTLGWCCYHCMSLCRNRCDTFWSLKHKIKIATATFVRDKKYKGFSKFIMEIFFKIFQILKFIFEGLRCISGRYVALMTPPHMINFENPFFCYTQKLR